MSRKTKRKSGQYGILEHGQVVRIDTILKGPNRYADAQHIKLAEVKWAPVDTDHTRAHREELKAAAPPKTKLLSQPNQEEQDMIVIKVEKPLTPRGAAMARQRSMGKRYV